MVNDGSVPESDMSNNVYKIEAPAKKKLKISDCRLQISDADLRDGLQVC